MRIVTGRKDALPLLYDFRYTLQGDLNARIPGDGLRKGGLTIPGEPLDYIRSDIMAREFKLARRLLLFLKFLFDSLPGGRVGDVNFAQTYIFLLLHEHMTDISVLVRNDRPERGCA